MYVQNAAVAQVILIAVSVLMNVSAVGVSALIVSAAKTVLNVTVMMILMIICNS